MTYYYAWTLTCDLCGQIFDNGLPYTLVEVKKDARRYNWVTGRTRLGEDYCSVCDSIMQVDAHVSVEDTGR